MTRAVLVAVAALTIAVLAVVLATGRLIGQSRQAVMEQIDADQVRTVDEVVRILNDDLEQIAADLRLLDHLLTVAEPAARTDEIASLLAWTRPYSRVGVYDASGRTLVDVRDPTMAPDKHPEILRREMQATAMSALSGAPSEFGTTAALEVEGGRLRVFAMPVGPSAGRPRRVVALLVDTEPLFAKLRLVTSQGGAHLLLLGVRGSIMPVSDPALAAAAKADHSPPVFSALLTGMRAAGRGTVHLGAAEAAQLGLGHDEVVGAFAPIMVSRQLHWAVAVLSSTTRMATHERALVRRFVAGAVALAGLLAMFAGYIVVSSRRATVLRERLRATDALARLHARTEKILNEIPTGVLTLTADARVVFANRALAARLAPNAIGAPLAEALAAAPPAVTRMLTTLLQGAASAGQVVSLHGERLALFGEEGQYNLHAVALDRENQDEHALLVIEDVSDVRALESQLVRAEKLATIGELAAGVAHEMGTPLGVVRGRAEYVLGKLGADHPQSSGLADIVEQIDQVTRVIRQLLDFSRVSPAAVQTVELEPAIRDVLELLRFECERRKVETQVDLDGEAAALSADPDQLRQVLVNLVRNALDACAAGGEVIARARLEADASAPWQRVRIAIVDNGCGIAPADLNRVFDPFYTTKKRGQGTGLGLAVTAQIVRNHGGEIAIESEEGRGTTVTLLWPTASAARERHASD